MNKRTTLLSTLPIVLILGALAAAIVFFPDSKDIRPRASDPAIFDTSNQQVGVDNLIGCADLYKPVCGANGVTYDSACEAQAAGVTIDYEASCVTIK